MTHDEPNQVHQINQLVERKSKLAIWIASEKTLESAKERLKLAEKLVEAGLNLDRMGRLFPEAQMLPSGHKAEFREFVREYKFYLAFENQWHCRDYITEKVWTNGFRSETVPVVWGATKKDYEAALPPNSFIFADDYSPEELTNYLNYLDKNDTAYMEYFRWRTLKISQMANNGRQSGVCQLCRILHGINTDNIFNTRQNEKYLRIPAFSLPEQPRIIHSLSEDFFGTENSECY